MGQSGIAMLNKVGYSMFWNSMWDNKNLYSRNLKEDFFINKFFDLIFNDNVSANAINIKKKTFFFLKNYKISIEENNNLLYKYLKNYNKLKLTSSKIWILKYQKWLILYKFVYIHNFSKLKKVNKNIFGNDYFYVYKFYNKATKLSNYNYFFYKKQAFNFNF